MVGRGQTVNICKCEHGEPVALGYNKGLRSIDPGTADNVKFYTRLYPMGSTGTLTEKYGFTRFSCPAVRSMSNHADKYGRSITSSSLHRGYLPKTCRCCQRCPQRVKTARRNPFTIYYFTDTVCPSTQRLYDGGLVIRVSFQEGSELAGLGRKKTAHTSSK